jgi:hypothetical protein
MSSPPTGPTRTGLAQTPPPTTDTPAVELLVFVEIEDFVEVPAPPINRLGDPVSDRLTQLPPARPPPTEPPASPPPPADPPIEPRPIEPPAGPPAA